MCVFKKINVLVFVLIVCPLFFFCVGVCVVCFVSDYVFVYVSLCVNICCVLEWCMFCVLSVCLYECVCVLCVCVFCVKLSV